MEIRQLHANEFEDSLHLSQYAFQYKLSEQDRERARNRFRPERVWGIYDQGELGAKLTLLPLEMYIQGRSISMGGIAGVATWPENRRQGLVQKLLVHALQTMNESGQVLSCLHPFLIPFYRKFGWEVYCEHKKYVIPVAKLPLKSDIKGMVKRDVKDIERFNLLYTAFAVQYNGMLNRDHDWWENSVLDGDIHNAVFYSQVGEPEGYVLYKIENKELIVEEFIYLNEDARRGLWVFLCNHDSMITQVVWKLIPADDILPFLLPDPRIQQENYPYFMARIVNATAFVEGLLFAKGSPSKITIQIHDKYAPWNEGVWEWKVFESGEASFIRVKQEGIQTDLSCDIGALTVLLLGYKRPEELYRYGALTGDPAAVAWVEKIVPKAQTALLDFF